MKVRSSWISNHQMAGTWCTEARSQYIYSFVPIILHVYMFKKH